MKKKTGIFLIIGIVLALMLTGCGKQSVETETAHTTEEDKLQIGLSFDSFVIERWLRDRDMFVSTAQSLGAEVNVQVAGGEVEEQISQIEYFIQKKMDVIIIIPIDGDALYDVVKEAKSKGICVICYDRIIPNVNADLYITIDNEMVGTLMGEALKKACPVPIGFEQIDGGAKGYFHTVENRIAIQEGMSQVQTIKTAIHEMTHQKLHSIDPTAKTDLAEPKLTRNHKEVEAESVAFTVCQHYGIDTGDYSFAYVAGWSHGKETPELKASLDKIRKTASEMITEIDEHLTALQKEYTWAHLTADDVKNIECTGSEYMPYSRMAEHTFSCEIVGEPMVLKLTVSQHDDGEGFTIHSEEKDVWDAMTESELRKLEPVLTSTAELHYWTSQVEKAETAEAVKEVTFEFMETENLDLSREQCQKFWEVVEQKEAALSPPSALADLQAKKEESKKEKSSKPKTRIARKKTQKRKKEESR